MELPRQILFLLPRFYEQKQYLCDGIVSMLLKRRDGLVAAQW